MSVQARGPRALAYFAISCAVVTGLFFWQGWQDFHLGDEGFLWYGAQRVIAGEVPLRDFQSYDPGRYYWSAAIMTLSGDSGIIALRAAVAAFEVAGLTLALLMISGRNRNPNVFLTVLAAATLSVWMYPRHKLFDITLSIALIGAFACLIRNATPRFSFAAGVMVGLVAVFGSNHGVYGVAGGLCVIAYLASRENAFPLLSGLTAGAAGVVVGYLPVLAMIAFVPGYADALWKSIVFLFEIKTTNLPLQAPWPWRVPIDADLPIATAQKLLVGTFFIALLAFGAAAIAFVVRRTPRHGAPAPELVSCAFLSLPYAHYAFSRPDIGHLALGIFPLLIGCFVAIRDLRAVLKWPLALALTAASLLIMLPHQPGWGCRFDYHCVETDVAGSKLNVDLGSANSLRILRELIAQYSPAGRSFVATPFWPGAYPAFGRASPMWEIYALFPRSEAFQLAEIERIKKANPGFILVWDYALDDDENLRFRNTHPLIDQFFRDHYDRLPDSPQKLGYQVYRSR